MTPDLVLLTRQGIKGTKVQGDFVLDVFSSLNSGWSSSGSVIVLSCSTRSRYVHSTQTRRPLAKCWTLEPNHRKRGNEGTTSVTWTSSPQGYSLVLVHLWHVLLFTFHILILDPLATAKASSRQILCCIVISVVVYEPLDTPQLLISKGGGDKDRYFVFDNRQLAISN